MIRTSHSSNLRYYYKDIVRTYKIEGKYIIVRLKYYCTVIIYYCKE